MKKYCDDKEREGLLKTVKTEKDFNVWKKQWYNTIPRCKDFRCIHELSSCGINYVCGDCSIWDTFKKGLWDGVCDNVNCVDCMRRHGCDKTDKEKIYPMGVLE